MVFRFLVVIMSFVHIFADTSKEVLFGNPSFISAKVSPDGNTIAYVGADEAGISNVFIYPTPTKTDSSVTSGISRKDHALSKGEQISFFQSPEIIQFFWSGDSKKVLLLKDENGTGQLHLHGIDIQSKDHVIYTEKFSKVNAKVIQISSQKNSAVIGLNNRNPHFHDLYVLDLESGDFKLLFQNDLYAKFLVSDSLDLVLKMQINDDGSWTVSTVDDVVFMQLSSSEAFQTEFLSYNEKNRSVYLLDNRFSDTNQLVVKPLFSASQEKVLVPSNKSFEKFDPSFPAQPCARSRQLDASCLRSPPFAGQKNLGANFFKNFCSQVLGTHPMSDIDEVLFIDGEPKAYASYYTQKQWHIIDSSIKDDIVFLEEQVGSNFEVVNQSKNSDLWIVSNSIPDQGEQFWIFERKAQVLSLLHSSTTGRFSKMYPMIVDARDGQKLICYYTLPKECDQGGCVERPIPLVVVPHGGPFKVRDKFRFNPNHQWLASCGYAVLSVNFRLSSGFGKAFVNAGNGEWGGKAHLDVIDAVEACIAKGITERGKLAVFGGSYGGYESLAALTFTPDYFTCCVAICGPSNLKTVLDNVPKFWEFTSKPLSDKTMFFTKRAFITSMGGDPDHAEGIHYLEKCSPLNYLEGVKAPLLLVHGKNDHVVAERESKQIYDSLKKNHKDVTYILFPDEGHRFAKFSNEMMYLNHSELFLSQHLGGRYQPVDDDIVAESSAQISH
jgi:dipeptidyl aminopeptidase/acylaminoacyl peptidase